MKNLRKYCGFLLILGIALCVKFYDGRSVYAKIETFRGAALSPADWNPMIAASVNNRRLTAVIDNHPYSGDAAGIYMDDNLNIMIPVSILRDSYHCSAFLCDSKSLVIEKYDQCLQLELDNPIALLDSAKLAVSSPMVSRLGEYYVPMQFVSEKLGYSYQWNIAQNQATAANVSDETNIFPTSYDLRKRGRNAGVKDQGSRGTCWAFAALTALETSLRPMEKLDFSPDHMSLENSFASNGDEGGQYTMSMAYLTSWTGPVLEADDPYDGVGVDNLPAVRHVQEAQVIESKNLNKIKEAVFLYGGVQSAIYSTLQNAHSQSSCYNSAAHAYCYVGQERPNHDVVIIGWDDNYPRDNFKEGAEGDGAFICQNSWGESFGEDGVFYVSYYDTNIGVHNVVYTRIEDVNNYDRIYQSDLCGWVGQIGYNRETIYAANVFTAESDEKVMAAGFYATGKNTEYEVFVVPDFTGVESLAAGQNAVSGKLENAGYYTIDLKTPVSVAAGTKFAVMVKISTPDSIHPLAIEYAGDALTANADLSDGEGYISSQGTAWEHVEETQNCNLCIKAYTDTER